MHRFTSGQWSADPAGSSGVCRGVSSAAAFPFRPSRAVGFSLPPLSTHSLSHCAPNPSLLCGEFHRRDSGARSASANGPCERFLPTLFNLRGKVCAPQQFSTPKNTTERHTVTSQHRNEGDYGRALIITRFFCFVLFVCFCRVLASFIMGLFNLYEDLYFTYLEINPLGVCFLFVSVSCYLS